MPVQIGIDLHVPEWLAELLSARRRGNLVKKVFQAIGQRWGEEFLPKHFTAEQSKYDFAPRGGQQAGTVGKKFWRSYTGRKQKKYGHTLALVYSGRSAQQARGFQVHATRNGAKVTVPAPTLNYRTRGSDLDMADEVRRITPDELRSLAAYGTRVLERSIKEVTGVRTKRLS